MIVITLIVIAGGIAGTIWQLIGLHHDCKDLEQFP